MKLIAAKPGDKGEVEISDEPLGKGGEGAVHSVISHTLTDLPDAKELVVKMYFEPEAESRPQKVKSMILAPPDSDSVAWPQAVVQKNGRFAGYIMTKLDFDKFRPWADLAHSQTRRKTAKDFDVIYAITAIRNFAVAIEAVHDEGHRLGDINESNMFVGTDSRVFLVDTDSAQIKDPKSDTVYPCLVGKPEYTAAELSKGSLKNHTRTEESDVFGFAVAAYQMLLGGPHPTDGAFNSKNPDKEPPETIEKIRAGIYPGLAPETGKKHHLTNPPRIAVEGIPEDLKKLFLSALSPTPENRPTLSTFIDSLDVISDRMVQCSQVKQHWYDEKDGKCGWCKHAEKTSIDPWIPEQKAPVSKPSNKRKASQKSLAGVNFGNSNTSGPAKRLPPQRAGSNNTQQPQQNQQPYNPAQFQPPQNQNGQYQQPPPQNYYPPQQPPQPPSQKDLQKQFKTKKTVLRYNDGTYGIRPSIGKLMQSNPKMAFKCLKDETPDYATFWWNAKRNIAIPWALLIGYVIALSLAVVWWFNFPEWLTLLAESQEWNWPWLDYIWLTFAYIGSIGTVITSTWLTISGLVDRHKTKKRHNNSLSQFKNEKWFITTLRYLSISVIYGPILVIGTVIALIVLTVNILLNLIGNVADSRKW